MLQAILTDIDVDRQIYWWQSWLFLIQGEHVARDRNPDYDEPGDLGAKETESPSI